MELPVMNEENAPAGKPLNSYEIVGGPHTFTNVWTTNKFREQNPKVYAAFVKAFNEAVDTINKDKAKAVDNYVKWANYKGDKALLTKEWSAATDRDFAIKGRHSRDYYRHADQWLRNEVAALIHNEFWTDVPAVLVVQSAQATSA